MTAESFLSLILSLAALAAPLPPVRAEGMATTYHPGDGHSGDTLGCLAAARRLYGSARFREGLPIVAMRPGLRPPCGSRVVVEHRGRVAAAVLLDSGPYGADCTEAVPSGLPFQTGRSARSVTYGGPTDGGGVPGDARVAPTSRRRVIRGPLPAGCRWRGIADLSRPIARAVGLRGRGYVRLRWAR